jgi:hypothetical protein
MHVLWKERGIDVALKIAITPESKSNSAEEGKNILKFEHRFMEQL